MNKIKPIITLGILSMILTIGICVQLKTIKQADITGSIKLIDSNLKTSLLQWKTKYEESKQKLNNTDDELETLRNNVANLEVNSENQKKMSKYQTLLGLTDLKGEGITIKLSDNNQISSNDSFTSINEADYMVHDGNLVSLVNELKSAGAEAISINGQRIINSTCITCAGNVIQINGEKVGSPFEVKAIGSRDLLYGELNKNGGTLYKLKKYGIITSVNKSENIEISKYVGNLK